MHSFLSLACLLLPIICSYFFYMQMFAEVQMLTPMVPTREVYFVRYCKQLNAEQWAIVDVSIDKVEDNIDASLVKCRKRPSGCIIEDKSNGHCKVHVLWVLNMLYPQVFFFFKWKLGKLKMKERRKGNNSYL